MHPVTIYLYDDSYNFLNELIFIEFYDNTDNGIV